MGEMKSYGVRDLEVLLENEGVCRRNAEEFRDLAWSVARKRERELRNWQFISAVLFVLCVALMAVVVF